jgi:hypothetical protein
MAEFGNFSVSACVEDQDYSNLAKSMPLAMGRGVGSSNDKYVCKSWKVAEAEASLASSTAPTLCA